MPNKRTLAIAERQEEIGCDLIEGMARIAMYESHPMQLRGMMYRELAQYVAPKRKAVKVTDEEGGPVRGEFTFKQYLEMLDGMTLGPPKERQGQARDVDLDD